MNQFFLSVPSPLVTCLSVSYPQPVFLTSSRMCRPSCQSVPGSGHQWHQWQRRRRRVQGSSCQPPPTSSLLWIQMESQTKIIIKRQNSQILFEHIQKMLMALEYTDCVCLILTVLRLLKRCFGASWPLQFFTYMLQLNSPSLQPATYTHLGRLFEKSETGHIILRMCVSTFRQQ